MGACNSILKDYKKEISFTHCPILEREKNRAVGNSGRHNHWRPATQEPHSR